MTKISANSVSEESFSSEGLRNAGLVSGFFVFALGGIGFLGWVLGVRAMVEIVPGFPPMSFPTSVTFLVLGLGLFLGAIHRRIGEAVAGLGVILIEFLFSGPFAEVSFFAIDRLFEDRPLADLAVRGASATEFTILTLLGMGLFLAWFPYHWRRALVLRISLGAVSLILVTLEILVYSGSIALYFETDEGAVTSIHTGFGLFVASIGFLGHTLESSPRVCLLERLGLSSRMAVLVLLSVLLISGMLWGLAFFAFNRSLVENDLQSIHFDVRLLENRLAHQHRVMAEDLLLMAHWLDLRDDFVRTRLPSDPGDEEDEEREAYLRTFLSRKPTYTEVGLASREFGSGNHFIYTRGEGSLLRRSPVRADQELWKTAFDDSRVGVAGFFLQRRPRGGEGREGDGPLKVSAFLLLDEDTMIFASMDLSGVLRRVEQRFTSSGKVVIVDANSWVLYGAGAFGARSGLLADRTLFSVLPAARWVQPVEERGEVYRFSMDGEYRGLVLWPFSPLQGEEGSLFRIGVIDDFSRAAVQSGVIRRQTLALGVPLLLGLSLVVFFLVRSVTQPLKDLTEAAEAFGRTGKLRSLSLESGDEIGQLARTFGEMAERVQERNDQLNKEIQRRVEWEHKRNLLIEDLEGKNRELAQVVYIASHDLRSPLVNIQGFSQEISLGCAEIARVMKEAKTLEELRQGLYQVVGEDLPESLDYIGASARKMDMLLKGLLKVSRVGTAELHPSRQDMKRLLEEVAHNFEYRVQENGGRIVLGKAPAVHGDATQINQVFSNLIENGFNYAHPDRKPVITIDGEVVSETGKVVYRVRDNGVGIPESHQGRIFALFQRLNPQGTEGEGLGLTIVRRIMQRHGGSVTVASEPDQWTEFTLTFQSDSLSGDEL